MSTVELKRKLIDEINKTSNPDTLMDLLRLLEINVEGEEIYKLSEEQKKSVIESQQQISSGKFFTNEAVNKEVDKWLNE